jgi:hypothetical protein
MADNKKISDLPNDSAVTLSDYIPIITTGGTQTKKASVASLLTLAGSGSGGSGSGAAAIFPDTFQVSLPNNTTGIPNGTTVNAGDLIGPFLEAAFRQASPAHYTQASLALSASAPPAVVEVGTTVSPTFTIIYNPNDAGAETSRVLNKNGSPLNAVSGVYSDTITAITSAITYRATINYAQGHVNNNSLGAPDSSGQIAAGHVDSNALSYQGFYKVFYGATDTAVTAGSLRSLPNSVFLSGSVIDFPSGTTARNFYIAVPPGHTLASLTDFTSSNASLIGSVTNTPITIADGGTGTLDYTLYKLTTGVPYSGSGDLFKFSIL